MSGKRSVHVQEYACLTCGETVLDRVPRKYCNRSCAAKSTGHLYPKRRKHPRPCTICGNHFTPKTNENSKCLECKVSTIATKEKSSEQGVRAHARRVMKKVERLCAVCSYATYVEVCHIKSIKSFPGETPLSVINARSNLTFLCPNHHKEFDLGLLPLRSV